MPQEPRPCIFCAIVEGKIPSKKVYEDGDSVAFLDINPRAKGMTIVSPKSHYASMTDNAVGAIKVFQTAQTVADMIKKSLGPSSVDLAILPSEEVPHFHIRLYPVYGEETPVAENQPFKMEDQELNSIAEKIKSARSDLFASSQKAEEKSQAKEWDGEDARYIRNQIEK